MIIRHPDQIKFANLSQDFNPMHCDEILARRLIYGELVVHGINAMIHGLVEWSEKLNSNTSKSLYGFYHLLLHRWVGINSMIVITKDKELLSFELFYKSLKEKYDSKSISFYEKNFKIKPLDNYKKNDSIKGNTLPGLMAFLFYSGSYTFLFFSIILFSFFATILEYLIYKSTNKNLIASGLIGMVVSYRFAHFGYLPSRSYLLFGSIIGLIILFFSIKFFVQFIKIKLNK